MQELTLESYKDYFERHLRAQLEQWTHENMSNSYPLVAHSILQKELYQPFIDFVARPAKRFRATMTLACAKHFKPNDAESDSVYELALMIEVIHAASLIIDDIEDQSITRRGLPCFHSLHGVAQAINTANWAYIWALSRLQKLGYVSAGLDTLQRGHIGQALDIHCHHADSLDEMLAWSNSDLKAYYHAEAEGKSALLFTLGPRILLQESEMYNELEQSLLINNFNSLGVYFQKIDDLRNLCDQSFEKYQEDVTSPMKNYGFIEYLSMASTSEKVAFHRAWDEKTLDQWRKTPQVASKLHIIRNDIRRETQALVDRFPRGLRDIVKQLSAWMLQEKPSADKLANLELTPPQQLEALPTLEDQPGFQKATAG